MSIFTLKKKYQAQTQTDGKTFITAIGWTDVANTSTNQYTVPIGYDSNGENYVSQMYYVINLTANTAYTFSTPNSEYGCLYRIYAISDTSNSNLLASNDVDMDTMIASSLTFIPISAGVYIVKIVPNDMTGMGQWTNVMISPNTTTYSTLTPGKWLNSSGIDQNGNILRYNDSFLSNIMQPSNRLYFYFTMNNSTVKVGPLLTNSLNGDGPTSYTTIKILIALILIQIIENGLCLRLFYLQIQLHYQFGFIHLIQHKVHN